MMSESFITELRPADVLLGRGSGPNDHEGNIRFRQLVSERKDEYLATNHRQTKARIATEIVNQVFGLNGRFLRKLEGKDALDYRVPEGIDAYVAVDEDTIMEKAKQALRQNTQKSNRDGQSTISPKPSSDQYVRPSTNLPQISSHIVEDFEPLPYGSSVQVQPMHQPQNHVSTQGQQQQMAYATVLPTPSTSQWIPQHREEVVSQRWQQQQHDYPAATQQQQQQHDYPAATQELQLHDYGAPTQQQQPWQPRSSHLTSQSERTQQVSNTNATEEEYDPDSMISYFRPPAVISTFVSNQAHGYRAHDASPLDAQHNNLPYSNDNSNDNSPSQHFFDHRRGSMTMNDLAVAHVNRRRYSNMSYENNMSEIMDSVSKMSVTNSDTMTDSQHQALQLQRQQRKQMYASTETMGTIEGFMAGGGNASMGDMSFATIDSSAFSTGTDKLNEDSNHSGAFTNGGSAHKLDRNTYAALSGNLAATISMPPPPSYIRPAGGARRRGRRTSMDKASDETHDIQESAEYIYHPPLARGEDTSNHSLAAGSVEDVPRPKGLLPAPANVLELNDLGSSSMSFKMGHGSTADQDLDMNSALFETQNDD
jgi:hypothetical protein